MTDWGRVARPSDYSAEVVLDHAYRARYHKPVPEDPTFMNGRVMLRPAPRFPEESMYDAPWDHPNVQLAEQMLRYWPEGFQETSLLLDTVVPLLDRRYGNDAMGCVCGAFDRFGEVFATCYDVVGFLEGMVHEMAHHKLHALGIHLEDWDDKLLLNNFDERYESSIRKDILRPMGAVLHAQYSYVYVLQAQLNALKYVTDARVRYKLWNSASQNAERLKCGHSEILHNVRTTDEGTAFIGKILEWSFDVITEGGRLTEEPLVPAA